MVKNLLLKVSEEHYLKLKRLLGKYNLTIYEFMDIITARMNESEMFLNYLTIKNRKDLTEVEFLGPDVDLKVKYPTRTSHGRRVTWLTLERHGG